MRYSFLSFSIPLLLVLCVYVCVCVNMIAFCYDGAKNGAEKKERVLRDLSMFLCDIMAIFLEYYCCCSTWFDTFVVCVFWFFHTFNSVNIEMPKHLYCFIENESKTHDGKRETADLQSL